MSQDLIDRCIATLEENTEALVVGAFVEIDGGHEFVPFASGCNEDLYIIAGLLSEIAENPTS